MKDSTRYNRQIILPEIGENGQHKLSKAKVLIIGAGGLGAAVLPYLAAAGVGEIGIVDDDVIEVSNLQRQVIYKTSAVGKYKVEEAKAMVSELNPSVKVNSIAEKLSGKNAIPLFEKYDIIVDATDNLAIKYLINDACIVTLINQWFTDLFSDFRDRFRYLIIEMDQRTDVYILMKTVNL
jgi:molybdopterin/thiamine biosynthesis adenylyltransferase